MYFFNNNNTTHNNNIIISTITTFNCSVVFFYIIFSSPQYVFQLFQLLYKIHFIINILILIFRAIIFFVVPISSFHFGGSFFLFITYLFIIFLSFFFANYFKKCLLKISKHYQVCMYVGSRIVCVQYTVSFMVWFCTLPSMKDPKLQPRPAVNQKAITLSDQVRGSSQLVHARTQ